MCCIPISWYHSSLEKRMCEMRRPRAFVGPLWGLRTHSTRNILSILKRDLLVYLENLQKKTHLLTRDLVPSSHCPFRMLIKLGKKKCILIFMDFSFQGPIVVWGCCRREKMCFYFKDFAVIILQLSWSFALIFNTFSSLSLFDMHTSSSPSTRLVLK